MKKIYVLVWVSAWIALSMCGISFGYYCLGDAPVLAEVNLMGTRIPFSNAPFVLDGEIMVPARLFQEKIGALVSWNDANSEMISYKDNIFLKLWQNNSKLQVNGKAFYAPVPAIYFKGELFASAAVLAGIYEMNYTIDAHRLDVAFRETHPETMQIGYELFRKFSFPLYGISLYFPEHYEMASEQNSYYLSNPYDPTRAEVHATSLPSDTTARSIVETRRAEILDQGGTILTTSSRRLSGFLCEVIAYETEAGEAAKDFLFLLQGMLYRITTYQLADSTSESIASTLSIDNVTLNENLEHYMEFPGMTRYGVQFQQSLYSNMLVRGKITLSGSIGSSLSAKEIVVTVTKGGGRFEYTIPIVGQHFSGTIYIPFGIGKHNIAFYIRETDSDANIYDNSARTVLKLSVLNESPQSTADLVPTPAMDYDRNEIYNLLNRIGYTGINQIETARNLYRWVIDRYDLDGSAASSAQRTLSRIVLDDTVSLLKPAEVCTVYAGLLRATGIPARIISVAVTEANRTTQIPAVEAFLNGKWYFMGIVTDMTTGTLSQFMLLTPTSNTGR